MSRVVVGLYDQIIRPGAHIVCVLRNLPEVSHEHETGPEEVQPVSERLGGIVRHLESQAPDTPHLRLESGPEHPARPAYLRSDSLVPREGIVQPCSSIHRHRQPLSHGSQSADMVHMIVRDKNHLHRRYIHTRPGKPGLHSPEAHPGIHYQSRALIPYVITVTVAPAGDTQKSCHKGLPWN